MLEYLFELLGGFHGGVFGGVDGEFSEAFPDVVDGLVGGVDHVFLIETIVAEFVEEDFVGREVMGVIEGFAHFVHRQKKRCLAQLVLVEAVLEVAQWRDGEDELLVGEGLEQFGKGCHGLVGGKEAAVEAVGGEFVAVGDDLVGVFF